jgi:hypothetical protein
MPFLSVRERPYALADLALFLGEQIVEPEEVPGPRIAHGFTWAPS